ncbi:hypothetical protein B0H11DRAFT_2317958 [Mycena galericulata]|nr:hypothetical protein B0H11DRAFT_2317958 [Mycena galericulata]
MEFLGVLQTGAASTLPLAIVLIVVPPTIQHLVLGTHHLLPNSDTHFSSSQGSHNKKRHESAIVFGAGDSEQAIELQSSVSVQSWMDDSGKTGRALTVQGSNPSKGTVSDITFGA